MLKTALRTNPNRVARSNGASIPAPTGGWNARDPLPKMKPQDAVILDNWIPRLGYVELRRGFIDYTTGASAPVKSLMVWRGPTSQKLLAASGTQIVICLSGGNFSSTAKATTEPKIQFTNFSNDAGNWLICCNGVDKPFRYSGAAFTDLAITGTSGSITLDQKNLIAVVAHKERLFFIEKASLRCWFLAVNAVDGASQLLDLGPVCNEGGALQCIGTWSLDGGQGQDDYLVLVSDQGEAVIYQGTDPSDANYWSLVGVFTVGTPLGRRALFKFGGDLQLLTTYGVIALSQALNLDRAQQDDVAVTDKVANAFSLATQGYSGNFGWQGVTYPKGQLAIYNIPVAESGTAYQYVQNLQNGAWCRFTDLNAICWAISGDNIFFGDATGVRQWDQGVLDGAAAITYDLKPAWNALGRPGQIKHVTMCRPVLNATENVLPAMEVLADFAESVPTAVPITTVLGGGSPEIRADWTSVAALGYYIAPRMRLTVDQDRTLISNLISSSGNNLVSSAGNHLTTAPALPLNDVTLQVLNFDLIYEVGDPL